MTKRMPFAVGLVLCGFLAVPLSFSGPDQNLNASSPLPSFEADLIRIDGDRYVVKDHAGLERQVHVGRSTELFGLARPGDRIQLWVQSDGHVQTIIVVQSGDAIIH